MGKFVSLLRGVNVSGHRPVKMADLNALYEELGHKDVQTYLQSGNVVSSAAGTPGKIAESIRQAMKKTFALEVGVQVISADDFVKIAKGNSFPSKEGIDPAFLHVTFLAEPPRNGLPKDRLPINGDEDIELKSGHLYLYCPHGYGRTKLNNNYFERLLKTSATTRNWKTVQALQEMAAS